MPNRYLHWNTAIVVILSHGIKSVPAQSVNCRPNAVASGNQQKQRM